VTGANPAAVQPLLPSDPGRLGRYQLVGRLGDGGMGTVYLAHAPGGHPVAVKVIRPELAHEPEFRERFRSEVERAREVPPFCTAEVVDADPDHVTPYLVVEYVDGPSLAHAVADRGPLTAGNLHGVAIGVATALTAIHGAGVIHRDLKPSNVLLAPGSPKVIDFGIARGVSAAGGMTRTDQMIGTIAYMAPERFDPSGGRAITPAADIFAWGAVVAYAGTGRTPFAADLPHVVAARILTQPPDLGGLDRPLRDLVGDALAKDPAQRPTARQLLDRLLTAGPARSGSLAAVLASQPALREAAEEARAATDHQLVQDLRASATPVDLGPGGPDGPGAHAGPGPYTDPGAYATTQFAYPAPAGMPPGPPAPVPPRSAGGWSRKAIPILSIATIIAALALAVIVVVSLLNGKTAKAPAAAPATSGPATAPPEFASVAVRDPLKSAGQWQARDDTTNQTTCVFDQALVVTKQSAGPYRCPGPKTNHTDFSATVKVSLRSPGSCAGIWFRFNQVAADPSREAGYLLRICADGYTLMTHGLTDSSAIAQLAAFPFDSTLAQEPPTRVGVSARGGTLTFTRDGQQVGEWPGREFASGRIVLGVAPRTTDVPPFVVAFTDIEIRTP
jgi:eukaryotic-like serine/threonine-protein kinase